MQDQGKRLLVAVAAAFALLLVWQWAFPPKKPPPKAPPVATSTAPANNATQVLAAQPHSQVACSVYDGPEQTIQLAFPKFDVTFSSRGGVVKAWQLTDPRYQRDPTNKGKMMSKGALVPAVPGTGDFEVNFTKGSTVQLPCNAVWTGTKVSATEVKYTLATDRAKVTKTFDIDPTAFTVKMTVQTLLSGPAGQHETMVVSNFGYQDPKQAGGGSSRILPREWQSSTSYNGTILSTGIKDLMQWPRFAPTIQWTGFEHPYMLAGFSPKPIAGAPVAKHTYANGVVSGLMQTDMVFPVQITTAPGQALASQEVVGYLGPKSYEHLDQADAIAGFSTGFKDSIDLGWFAFIGKPLLWLLLKFQMLVGNWGLAIILLTFVLKAVTLQWTAKSTRSMKAMAVLGPQIKSLNEKYKTDKQRLQVETMALYKEHGVNPLSGCLPMLVQMPIWWALYRMLESAGELYLQPFIPGWINDLTAADPTYVLPVLLVVTMFVQAKLTPQTADPSQKTQQRMMQYGMPLVFGAMAFVFPTGLTLYIFVSTILSALQNLYMNKYDKKSIALTEQLKQAKMAKTQPAVVPEARVRGAKDANVKADTETAAVKGDAPVKSPQPARAPNRPKRNKKGRR